MINRPSKTPPTTVKSLEFVVSKGTVSDVHCNFEFTSSSVLKT